MFRNGSTSSVDLLLDPVEISIRSENVRLRRPIPVRLASSHHSLRVLLRRHDATHPLQYRGTMSSGSGGVAAAFGFRYQYLVTVEILLDLFESDPEGCWSVGVDRADQDSADVLVYDGQDSWPTRAIQVKASLESSSTTMGTPGLRKLIRALATEHPRADALDVITNRTLAPSLHDSGSRANTRSQIPCVPFSPRHARLDHRSQSLADLSAALLGRLVKIRRSGAGGLGTNIHNLLLVQLVDLVHECGSRPANQLIDCSTVSRILLGPPSLLAQVLNDRPWGKMFGVPCGELVAREGCESFLGRTLTGESLAEGTPRAAVLSGAPGNGKTSAALHFVQSRSEHYAFTLWLDASGPRALAAQIPSVLTRFGLDSEIFGDGSRHLRDQLEAMPAPWLLVLDGAGDYTDIEPWIPRSGYGHVLITSQRPWPRDRAATHDVGVFDESEALALVRARLDSSSKDLPAPTGPETVHHFIDLLGRWPLAIELACSWVRRLGGDEQSLPQFIERFERLDLGDESLKPDGYHETAEHVALDLWNSLSEEAKTAASLVLASGGYRVPIALLRRWKEEVLETIGEDLNIEAAIRELLDTSLASAIVQDEGLGPNQYDEVISLHSGVQRVLERTGIPLSVAQVFLWTEVYSTSISLTFASASFGEGSLLLPSALSLLQRTRPFKDPQPLVIALSMLMHNAGTLASVTGPLETAVSVLRAALTTREEHAEHTLVVEPGAALMQAQTLGALITTSARLGELDDIVQLAEYGLSLVEQHEPDLSGEITNTLAPALQAVLIVMPNLGVDAEDLTARIENRLGSAQSPPPAGDAGGAALVWQLQAHMDRSRAYAESEQWSRAVNSAVSASNQALEVHALTHDATEMMLDVGALLITSFLKRPLSTPPTAWQSAMRRIVQWLTEQDIDLSDSQRVRLRILVPVSELDERLLARTIDDLHSVFDRSELLDAWLSAAHAMHDLLSRASTFMALFPLSHSPDGMEVIRTQDGGDSALWWKGSLAPGEGPALPVLIFTTSSARGYRNGEEFDPCLELLNQAGFPSAPAPSESYSLISGWALVTRGTEIRLRDHDGTVWLTIDDEQFSQDLRESQVTLVAYGDLADRDPAAMLRTAPSGLIEVFDEENPRSGEESQSAAPGKRRRWRKRLRTLFSRS